MWVGAGGGASRNASLIAVLAASALHLPTLTVLSARAGSKRDEYKQLDFGALEADIAETRTACELAGSPLVFAHADLLSGNLLLLRRPGDSAQAPLDLRTAPLQVIDFEYSMYAPRGFDVGNHFTEYAGFECDYTRCAPAGMVGGDAGCQ